MLSELAKEFIMKNAQNMTINELCNHLQNKYSSKEIRSFCYRKGISIKKLSKSERSALMSSRKYSSYNATKINHNYRKRRKTPSFRAGDIRRDRCFGTPLQLHSLVV